MRLQKITLKTIAQPFFNVETSNPSSGTCHIKCDREIGGVHAIVTPRCLRGKFALLVYKDLMIIVRCGLILVARDIVPMPKEIIVWYLHRIK